MVEVTDADREAAEDAITCTTLRGEELAYEFARHRIAAEQRGKLEGARLALRAASMVEELDLTPTYAVEISDAIRALSPAKIVGEG